MRRAYIDGTIRIRDEEGVVIEEFDFEGAGRTMEMDVDNMHLIRDPINIEVELYETVIKTEGEE